ncbi:MAG: flavodoxin family protein [Acidimicrobiales bacterium]
MRAVVVYESMYGNTHEVAGAIAEGLGPPGEITVASVDQGTADLLSGAELVVVGGPTHAHGMSRKSTRRVAVDTVEKRHGSQDLDAAASGPGVRDWLASLGTVTFRAAAFDTRAKGPALVTGRASTAISRQLRKHGCDVVSDPESFVVGKDEHLEAGELDRARAWGRQLAARCGSTPPTTADGPAVS